MRVLNPGWRRTLHQIGIAVLGVVSIGFVSAREPGIRDIDFKNFVYGWEAPQDDYVPTSWRWTELPKQTRIHLINGIHKFVNPHATEEVRQHSPSLTFNSVAYGDLDGDGTEEAAVTLNYSSGGTSNWNYLYVYKLVQGKLQLLGVLQSGSRADGGLIKTAIQDRLLILDFADSERRIADCCSDGYVRARYRWIKGRLVEDGPRERGSLKPDDH
jgi:hypothetical protein